MTTRLSSDRERDLVGRAKAGDADALTELVLACVRIGAKLAHRYANPMLPVEDLLQEAMAGFVEAVDNFDLKSGRARFTTYGRYWARKRVTLAVINQSALVRIPEHVWRARQVDQWSSPVVGYPPDLVRDRRFTAMEGRR